MRKKKWIVFGIAAAVLLGLAAWGLTDPPVSRGRICR